MALDDKGVEHCDVGTGAESFWVRRTNRYPGCSCPAWRYSPKHPKPTNPLCEIHGETNVQPPRTY